MTITFKRGDIFAEPVDALVNPVNCVGAMGKGLALEFKKRWPDYFLYYRKMCEQNMLRMGEPTFYRHFNPAPPIWLISFPTKRHWVEKSNRDMINLGLGFMLGTMERDPITSIAFPALGCGLGGLDFAEVKPLFERFAGAAEQVMPQLTNIVVFEPQ